MLRPRDARHSVLIRGRMRADGPFVDVCIRNVSRNGMMLQAPQAPRRGTFVEIRLPEDVVVGQVIWASERRFGIKTRDRVPVSSLLGKPTLVERSGSGGGAPRMAMASGAAARAHSHARASGRSMEFVFLALAVTAVAGFFAFLGYQALSNLTAQITTHL
jgi:hypothetical protein